MIAGKLLFSSFQETYAYLPRWSHWSCPPYTTLSQARDCVWIAATHASVAMERALCRS